MLPTFQTVAEAAGRLDGKQTNVDLGIERISLKVPVPRIKANANVNFAAWLNPGATFQQQWADKPVGTDQTTGEITYRFFYGCAGGWKPSSTDKLQFNTADIATLDKLKDQVAKLPKDASTGTAAQQFTAEMAGLALLNPGAPHPIGAPTSIPEAQYESELAQEYKQYSDANTQEPTWALWVENRGWDTAIGAHKGPNFDEINAITLNYWVDWFSQRDNLQVRWENGYPYGGGEYLNQILATVGLNF